MNVHRVDTVNDVRRLDVHQDSGAPIAIRDVQNNAPRDIVIQKLEPALVHRASMERLVISLARKVLSVRCAQKPAPLCASLATTRVVILRLVNLYNSSAIFELSLARCLSDHTQSVEWQIALVKSGQ